MLTVDIHGKVGIVVVAVRAKTQVNAVLFSIHFAGAGCVRGENLRILSWFQSVVRT
jgi:hypothetical protein